MYEQTSGQVFHEKIVGRESIASRPEDWSRRRLFPRLKHIGRVGPASLLSAAINVVATNIGDIEEGALDNLPIKLLWNIWNHLEARGLNFHAWKLLSKILRREDPGNQVLGLYRYRHHICEPRGDLNFYLEPLASPTAEFVAHLVISGGCRFKTSELLALANMKNIVTLELIQPSDEITVGDANPFPDISDRLVRGWTEMGVDPFPLLRVLRIWGDNSTTQESLQYAAKFPSLVMYDVMGHRGDWNEHYEHASDTKWIVGKPVPGLDGSCLQALTLFADLDAGGGERLKELARNIDNDLIAICNDSHCSVELVEESKAPQLQAYFSDPAKVTAATWDADAASREAIGCSKTRFDAWAFWLYSFTGQLNQNRDIKRQGIQVDSQAVAGPFTLPCKPFATIYLGHSARGGASMPSYVRRGFFRTKRYIFVRPSLLRPNDGEPVSEEVQASMQETSRNPRPMQKQKQKKRSFEDMLKSLAG